jgi:hypothetical protein
MGSPARGLCICLFAAHLAGWSGAATAASIFELNFWLSGPRYDAVVPLCDTPFALRWIRERFGTKERRFWESDLKILDFERIREVSFRPWAANTIPRRYCSATALVSDGKPRTIRYSIAENSGMIGGSWGVEWCVVGLDRNWAYHPACKMALP